MYALGTHYLIELKHCNPEKLRSLEKIRNLLLTAAKKSKATIIDYSFREFDPFGISGVVIIAESHFTIHTWPEYGFAAVDIFTCGDFIKSEIAATYLIEQLECKDPSIIEMKRGLISHKNEKLPHKISRDSASVSELCHTMRR